MGSRRGMLQVGHRVSLRIQGSWCLTQSEFRKPKSGIIAEKSETRRDDYTNAWENAYHAVEWCCMPCMMVRQTAWLGGIEAQGLSRPGDTAEKACGGDRDGGECVKWLGMG